MEIDKVFSSDVDGVADNLFSAVKNSVSEIKAMQQRKAAENVQLVIQALKKIESDLQDKFDGVTTVIEKRVATIKDGRDGLDGRNGRDGKDGRPGRDGAPGARGPAGVPGTNGRDGEDGVSVTDARIDFDGSLIISLSSGREINVGEVVAPDLAEKIKVITNGGGTSQVVLDTLASLQAQITAISNFGYVNYVGTWNANTNSPTITSGSGDKGDYYVVSVAGFTNIDGQTLWGVGDWIIFNGSVWQKVDGGSTGDFTNLSASGTVTFTGLNASQAVFTNGSDELVSNAITGTGNVVMSASPTLTGTASLAALTTSSTVTHNGGTANGVAYLNGSKVLTTGSALTFDGTSLGIGAATPIAVSGYSVLRINGSTGGLLELTSGNTRVLQIQSDGASAGAQITTVNNGSNPPLIFGVNSTEQMRLTSTGLGIGTSSPGAKLDVNGGTNSEMRLTTSGSGYLQVGQFTNGAFIGTSSSDATAGQLRLGTGGASQVWLSTTGNLGVGTSSPGARLQLQQAGGARARFSDSKNTVAIGSVEEAGDSAIGFFTQTTTERMRLDSSGNLGLGVTPSAWGSGKAFEIGSGGNGLWSGSGYISLLQNTAFTSGAYRYVTSQTAARFDIETNAFKWYTAPSGTAGNAISFTQAMTLDASGRLLIGTTSVGGATRSRIFDNSNSSTILVVGGSTYGVRFGDNGVGGVVEGVDTTGAASYQPLSVGGSEIRFTTSSTERARIDSSGNLLVGTTTQPSGATARQVVKYTTADYVSYFWNTNATPYGVRIQHDTDVNGTGNEFLACFGNATTRATIRSNGGIANYSANDVNLSDRREKTNFAPAKSYLDTICAIPVQTFNYIDQSEDDPGLTLGVVAQDVQAVAPELVMESNWGTEDNPKMRLSIYQTDLQYALMKALQELKAEFDAYKATHP